jgi:hypothetical protein
VEQLQGTDRSREIKLFEIAGTPIILATLLMFLEVDGQGARGPDERVRQVFR